MKKIVLITLLVIGLSSCRVYNVEITWVKTNIMGNLVNSYVTYAYDHGVCVSWIWHSKFMVSGDESGDIKITAYGPDNKKTCKRFVESGETYNISVKGSMSSGGSDCDIFLESTSFETMKILTTTDFQTSIQEIKIEEVD